MNLGFEPIIAYSKNSSKNDENIEITVEKLEKGFGHTIGNAMRRVMLSSVPGAGFIGLFSEKLPHQFMTIPGTSTTVTSLIDALKQVRLKIDGDQVVTLKFVSDAAGVCIAGQLQHNSNVEILSPEVELLMANEPGVEFEVYARNGRGYVAQDAHLEFENRPDVIGIDGQFSPVRKANYTVEHMLSQNKIYDLLKLEVSTDKSLSGEEVIGIATNIIRDMFSVFDNVMPYEEKIESFKEEVEEEANIDEISIGEMDLKPRSFNALSAHNVKTIGDLGAMTKHELGKVRNLGALSVTEIIEKLENDYNIELKNI